MYLRPGSNQYQLSTERAQPVDHGTGRGTNKYTGDMLLGIATMHKSNAVPVTKGSDMAIATAKMRRG